MASQKKDYRIDTRLLHDYAALEELTSLYWPDMGEIPPLSELSMIVSMLDRETQLLREAQTDEEQHRHSEWVAVLSEALIDCIRAPL